MNYILHLWEIYIKNQTVNLQLKLIVYEYPKSSKTLN